MKCKKFLTSALIFSGISFGLMEEATAGTYGKFCCSTLTTKWTGTGYGGINTINDLVIINDTKVVIEAICRNSISSGDPQDHYSQATLSEVVSFADVDEDPSGNGQLNADNETLDLSTYEDPSSPNYIGCGPDSKWWFVVPGTALVKSLDTSIKYVTCLDESCNTFTVKEQGKGTCLNVAGRLDTGEPIHNAEMACDNNTTVKVKGKK
jgi:hypothetical protein